MGSILEDLSTRIRVWRAAPPRGRALALAWQPEPRAHGSARAGARLLEGTWHLAGATVVHDGAPWTIAAPSAPFAVQLHGMGWLDDLMALGGREAQRRARDWTLAWVARHGAGGGPGWAPAPTGRRLLRMICHAPALLAGAERTAPYFDALYRQARVLADDWPRAAPGLPRMEALTGLLYAGLTLEGMADLRPRAVMGLAVALAEDVRPDGGIASRNPEALLEVATLLNWVLSALEGARHERPAALMAARRRIVPTLRALRHADGGLARFHGGAAGREGRLDRALAASGVPARNDSGLAMGFLPAHHGRTSLVVDADVPPAGAVSGSAHASTLAFELTSGATPVIVSCGPGGAFGPDWHRAGRATASHSTLSLDGHSSARVGAPIPVGTGRVAPLVQGPREVMWQRSAARRSSTLILSHDGWRTSHGLIHLRRLVLSTDGRTLQGEDALRAVTAADKERLEDVRLAAAEDAVGFAIRFHLHPDATAEIGLGGQAASIVLPSGETWLLRPGRGAPVSIEPSVHLDPARLHPRPSSQVVFTGRLLSYAATVDWTLTRVEEAGAPAPHPSQPPERAP